MSKNRILSAPPPVPQLLRPVAPPTRVSFVIVPRFNMATLITMIEPLRVANYLAPEPLYQWEILSPDGTEIPASNGLSITALPLDDRNRRGETIFALASWGAEDYANRDLFAWLPVTHELAVRGPLDGRVLGLRKFFGDGLGRVVAVGIAGLLQFVGGEPFVIGLALGLEIAFEGLHCQLAILGFAAAGTTGAAGEEGDGGGDAGNHG